MKRTIKKPAKRGKVPSNVIRMAVRQVSAGRPYKTESELAGKIEDTIYEYDGRLSVVAVLGVLDMIKARLMAENEE
jgi:hypothetical protein